MKQCPRCNRTYTDETLLYCLDDGSVLSAAYDPQATQRMPYPRTTNIPPAQVAPAYLPSLQAPQQGRSQWPVYVLIMLLLLVLGGGAITLLIFGYTRLQDSSAAANLNQNRVAQDSPSRNSPSPDFPSSTPTSERLPAAATPASSPAVSPTPEARLLVGVWRANVYENNESLEITYTFFANGTSKAVFKNRAGQTQMHYGQWRYSDGILFETFSSGASGKGAIKWIDRDNVELTIIDNGIPIYNGLKRRYRRISDSAKD